MGDGFDIVQVSANDVEKAAEFIRQHFYTQEPINLASGAGTNRPTCSMYSISCIPEGRSLMAISKADGSMLGLSVNGEMNSRTGNYCRRSITNVSEAYKRVNKFLSSVEERADIYNLTGCDRTLHIHVLVVHKDAKGKGIGRALVEHTREKARSEGFPMISILCSSAFSATLVKKLGMHTACSIPYAENQNEDGSPMFNLPEPHTHVTMFVQKLSAQP